MHLLIDDDALATADAAIAACKATWPDVRVDRALVVERLARLAAPSAHLGELCLAWAGLAGDAAAQRAIDQLIRAESERAVRELRQPAHLADDVHGELAQRLLVATADSGPRLETYAGQAPLGRWLAVAATRTALNLMRGRRSDVPLDADDGDNALAISLVDPDLAIVRDRYRDDVREAVRASFEALVEPRDRNLLRLYYFEHVGLDELGRMFAVHASTVSRWLSALREQLVEDTRFRLAERLGIAGHAGDVDSVIRAMRSELDLTLSRILRT